VKHEHNGDHEHELFARLEKEFSLGAPAAGRPSTTESGDPEEAASVDRPGVCTARSGGRSSLRGRRPAASS
jgi:hypothetical protein